MVVTWTTKTGAQIPVKSMDDDHLRNCVKMMLRLANKKLFTIDPHLVTTRNLAADLEVLSPKYWDLAAEVVERQIPGALPNIHVDFVLDQMKKMKVKHKKKKSKRKRDTSLGRVID